MEGVGVRSPKTRGCELVLRLLSSRNPSSLLFCNTKSSSSSSLIAITSSSSYSWSFSHSFFRKACKSENHGHAGLCKKRSPSRPTTSCSNYRVRSHTRHSNNDDNGDDNDDVDVDNRPTGVKSYTLIEEEEDDEAILIISQAPQGSMAIIFACCIGLLTGVSVVIFNIAVHALHDLCWDGIPYRGASWLREEPIEKVWEQVLLVPACGGLVVGMLNMLRGALEVPTDDILASPVKAVLEPILKTLAACVTLGTGNSLGPEGPSVEIGASIAKGVGALFDRGAHRSLSLKAAGSAAGISSGFNAAVAGCFFAIESVLWPSPAESSLSLTNTTSMVILSAVIGSVVSEIGLGSEPAFKIPDYDFRSPSELPLYLLLGILCGFVSLTLSRCTSFMLVAVDEVQRTTDMPKVAFPVLGGLAVGLIALAYPEILYWGFENVDILIESRPFVKGLSVDLLLQLVAIKIVATSLCRACGLVGGYYAPSLFIGAATGMAYGKVVSVAISQSNPIFHISFLEVASPQAYGLVGMAATLSGVCQVPLTAVLLLFELTQDYWILLPLLAAVGVSSWITSGQTRRSDSYNAKKLKEGDTHATQQPEISSCNRSVLSSNYPLAAKTSHVGSLCELDSSLCLYDSDDDTKELAKRILVSQAMRTRYVTVRMSTLLTEAVTLMLMERQPCAVIVDDNGLLIDLLTIGDIHQFSKLSKAKRKRPEGHIVSEVRSSIGGKRPVSWTVTASMNLLSAQMIMNRHSMNQLPVILKHVEDHRGLPVGLLDRECISLACRALATRESLGCFPHWKDPRTNSE